MRKFFVIYFIGFIGVLTLLCQDLPMPEHLASKFTKEQFKLVTLINPTLLVLLLGGLGSLFAPRLGFSSILAGVNRERAKISLKEIISYVLYSCPLLLLSSYWLRSQQLAASPEASIITRLGYGSLTEEIMSRWGFLSLLLFLLNKLCSRFSEYQTRLYLAIVLSASFFAIGHFGIVSLFYQPMLSVYVSIFVTNFAVGFLASRVFIRQSLEASMLFHATISLVLVAIEYFLQFWLH